MFGGHFYHQRVRKSVAMFGSLFNNLYVLRKNSSGAVVSQVKVPLAYANRSKVIERINQMDQGEQFERAVAVKLPRLSFEIISMNYDPTRQLSKTNNLSRAVADSVTKRYKIYTGVPYNIQFQLNAYAKTQDDCLQIVEQIIPFFNPQYTLTVKPFSAFSDYLEDVPLVLTSVAMVDDYEGAVEQRRTIIYTLDFEMKVNFHGNYGSGGQIIRKATNKIYNIAPSANTVGADSDQLMETLTVLPDGLLVSADSDYGFTETIVLAADSA